VVTRARQRLAQRAERPGARPSRGAPNPEDSTRGAGASRHRRSHARPRCWSHRGHRSTGTDGNSGIAGHRDGFFRGLKDIATGDWIELETLSGKEVYRVEQTWVVDPEDVSVLDPTPRRALTLVTCYPFYFVGAAPRRFIVRAVLTGDRSAYSPPLDRVPCFLCGRRFVAMIWRSHVS